MINFIIILIILKGRKEWWADAVNLSPVSSLSSLIPTSTPDLLPTHSPPPIPTQTLPTHTVSPSCLNPETQIPYLQFHSLPLKTFDIIQFEKGNKLCLLLFPDKWAVNTSKANTPHQSVRITRPVFDCKKGFNSLLYSVVHCCPVLGGMKGFNSGILAA